MKKKIFLILTFIILCVSINVVSAEEAEISASVSFLDKEITISGRISSGEGKEVSIQVLGPLGHIIYMNQIKSGEDGNFEVTFGAPYIINETVYTVIVGGEEVEEAARLSFKYVQFHYSEEPDYIVASIRAATSYDGEIFNIDGTITTGENKEISVLLTYQDGEVIYDGRLISSINGNFQLDIALPEDAKEGVYRLRLDGEDVQYPFLKDYEYKRIPAAEREEQIEDKGTVLLSFQDKGTQDKGTVLLS